MSMVALILTWCCEIVWYNVGWFHIPLCIILYHHVQMRWYCTIRSRGISYCYLTHFSAGAWRYHYKTMGVHSRSYCVISRQVTDCKIIPMSVYTWLTHLPKCRRPLWQTSCGGVHGKRYSSLDTHWSLYCLTISAHQRKRHAQVWTL